MEAHTDLMAATKIADDRRILKIPNDQIIRDIRIKRPAFIQVYITVQTTAEIAKPGSGVEFTQPGIERLFRGDGKKSIGIIIPDP